LKHTATIAHIRQLCCLGLGGEAIMPSLLKALHDLVPSDSNGFFWVDAEYELSNLWAERMLPPDVMALYFREFYNRPGHAFKAEFLDMARNRPGVVRVTRNESFYKTDYYNLIWRNLNAHHAMYALIHERDRCLGQLSIYRAASDPPFTQREENLVASVTRYIAHGLLARRMAQNDAAGFYRDSDYEGLIILTPHGHPQYMSPVGRKLLFMATHPQISRSTASALAAETLPAALARICSNLGKVFKGEDAPPPLLYTENAWGRFVFRAYWLEQDPLASGGLIGVTVQHQEPLPIKLLDAMKTRPLSAKQKEVILLLAEGASHTGIADRLNVSLNTVNYHVKQIYDKLDVHGRADLLAKLLD
jgi:DNA-binding CsgD family transcriptional regulator